MAPEQPKRAKRVLAVASGGGHWEQIMMLREVFDENETHYVTTDISFVFKANISSFSIVRDCNYRTPFSAILCFAQCIFILVRQRPDYIVSTGAAPGFLCILAGRVTNVTTIWIDSIANAEIPSLSGRLVRRFASVWLTQWKHLEGPAGPHYEGSVF